MRRVRYVVVDGNIGSGKTTMLSALESRGFTVVTEPVEEWCSEFVHRGSHESSPISKFYEDPIRYAMPFQLHVLTTSVNKLTEAFSRASTNNVVIIERDPFDIQLFVEDNFRQGRFSTLEHRVFSDLIATVRRLVAADHVGSAYLRLPPELCMDRIQKRNRVEEAKIELNYVKELHEMHEAKYRSCRTGVPFTVVDAGEGPIGMALQVSDFIAGL